MLIDLPLSSPVLKKVFDLEQRGEYRKAYNLLANSVNFTSFNYVNNQTDEINPEIILRLGALTGYLGVTERISDSLDYSKSLLITAFRSFKKSENIEKVVETLNYLTLTYYNKGEYEQASIYIEESLSHTINPKTEIRLHTHIIKTLILLAERRNTDVINYLDSFRDDFETASHLLCGCAATNYSLAYKNLGSLDIALKYLNLARRLHLKSKHKIYLATAENNLAQIYKQNSEFKKAIKLANNAIRLFQQLGDKSREAFSIDTKAEILLALGDTAQSLDLIDEAIEMLTQGDHYRMLCEAYQTKAKILLKSNQFAESVICISKAINISDTGSVLKIAESFETECKNPFPPFVKKSYSQKSEDFEASDLKLELPDTISREFEFFGVWIKNDVFSEIGLVEGVLAIIASSVTKNGDLVAVSENNSDLVSIGYLDKEFGMICLESEYGEPELFDEDQVKILGRIVGFCKSEPTENNRYKVTPI